MIEREYIRFVFFSDTHLGFDYPIRPRIERRRRGDDFFDNFYYVLSYCIANKVDFVVHGGDLFFRSKLPQIVVDKTYNLVLKFAKHGIKLFIVPGNHERSRLPNSLLFAHPHIFIFDRPRTYVLKLDAATLAISGFPFQREDIRKQFPSLLLKTNYENNHAEIRLLTLHQIIEGATVGPSNYTFRNSSDVIKRQDIPGVFTAVLAGHIHRKQILNCNSQNKTIPVIYAGSIERTSFAEKDEPKGFFELELCKSSENNWILNKKQFIELPTRPMNDLVIDQYMDAKILKEYLVSKIATVNPNSIVRLSLNDKILPSLNFTFFREIFPDTMNYQVRSITDNKI